MPDAAPAAPTETPSQPPVQQAPQAAPTGDSGQTGEAPKEKSFREMWPEEYQKDPALKNYDNVEQVLKSFKHAQSLVGADKADLIKKPKDVNDKAGWDAYYAAIGRPESADKYVMPKGLEAQAENFKGLAERLHAAGANNDHFRSVVEHIAEMAAEADKKSTEEYEAKVAENSKQLKSLWGAAYEQKTAEVKAVMNTFDKETKEMLEASGAFISPQFLNWLSEKVSPSLRESTTGGGTQGGGGQYKMSPSEAKSEWNRLQSDQDFVGKLMNNDVRAVEKRAELFSYMYPSA